MPPWPGVAQHLQEWAKSPVSQCKRLSLKMAAVSEHLPDEKIERLRELCRKHGRIELTREEAAEFGVYLVRLIRAVHGI